MNFEMVSPGTPFPATASFLKGAMGCTTSSTINFIVDNSFAAPSGHNYLGILVTDPEQKFSSAQLYSKGEPFIYEFYIDDLILGVPGPQDPDLAEDCDVDGRDLYLFTASPFTGESLAEFALRYGAVSFCLE